MNRITTTLSIAALVAASALATGCQRNTEDPAAAAPGAGTTTTSPGMGDTTTTPSAMPPASAASQ